jgi:hypothetical protein
MATFSRETVESAKALAQEIVMVDFPADFSGLDIIVGVHNLEIIAMYKWIWEKEDANHYKFQLGTLNDLGIDDDESAIAYIQKTKQLFEKWKPIQSNFIESVVYPRLQELKAEFMAKH